MITKASTTTLAALLTICIAALTGPTGAQDPTAFTRELANVESMVTRGSWRSAERALHRLLDEHAGASYVLDRRDAIRETMRRCQFQIDHVPPRPDGLIQGKLIRHDRRSRQLELRYGPDDLADFEQRPGSAARLHPAVFDGPYTITLTGTAYPADDAGVRLLVCLDGNSLVDIVLGYTDLTARRGVAMTMIHRTGDRRQPLVAEQRSPLAPGQRYDLRVEVGAGEIVVSQGPGHTELMRARRPGSSFGRFGLCDTGFEQLTMTGTAGPGWLQAVVDAEVQRQLVAFGRDYDERAHLPAWLFEPATPDSEHVPVTPRCAATDTRSYPGQITADQQTVLQPIARLIQSGQYAAARDQAEDLAPDQAPPAARAYLLALCLSALEEPEAALARCDTACAADPTFAGSLGLRARILAQLRRHDDAVRQLRTLLTSHPDHEPAHRFLALLLLELGRPSEAAAVLQAARHSGVALTGIAALERTLEKALRGPSWRRGYEHRSTNYVVRSDIDQRTCVDSARVLEQAYQLFQSQLAPTAKTSREPFAVYVFASKAGFDAYCEDVLGVTRPHSTGLYSSALKQLLIWNVPDYGELLETVRHEGLHQYLDLVLADPPIWLNEGLAEYYEVDDSPDGRPRGGAVRPDLLAQLDPARMVPLGAFLTQSTPEFHADAAASYAQAWALVHMLRHTTRARREQFDRLFTALGKAKSTRLALQEALRGASIDELDRELREYVRGLQAQAGAAPR